MLFLSTLLVALFITLSLIPILRTVAARIDAVDLPDSRKVHDHPVPRVGGIAMAVGVILPVLLWAPMNIFGKALIGGVATIVLFGILDDLFNLPWSLKFLGQFAAALIVIVFGGLRIHYFGAFEPQAFQILEWLSFLLTLFIIVGATNAINLSDGLDGLAGGVTLFSFLCIGFIAFQNGRPLTLMVAVATIGAVFGFLRFNTHPAVIFMGDTGSQLLGFLAISLSMRVVQADPAVSPAFPLLLLGFPVLDTLTVMAKRIINGKSPFKADRNHFHHKLMVIGLLHKEAVFVIYMLHALLVSTAFVLRFSSTWLLVVIWLLFWTGIMAGFRMAGASGWKMRRFQWLETADARLRRLKQEQFGLKVAFPVVKWLTPVLLMVSSLLNAAVPRYFGILSLIMAVALLVSLTGSRQWSQNILRLSLYLLIPFMMFIGAGYIDTELTQFARRCYNLSFGLLTLFTVLTLKFAKRSAVHLTPLDFLFVFIALVAPNLPDPGLRNLQIGFIATRALVLLFSYDVLIGELHGKLVHQGLLAAAALVIVSIKAFA
jgi:UDP-GlcNAc:undecaprenyl-phosphate GlcNAc-1-phosphate transferase